MTKRYSFHFIPGFRFALACNSSEKNRSTPLVCDAPQTKRGEAPWTGKCAEPARNAAWTGRPGCGHKDHGVRHKGLFPERLTATPTGCHQGHVGRNPDTGWRSPLLLSWEGNGAHAEGRTHNASKFEWWLAASRALDEAQAILVGKEAEKREMSGTRGYSGHFHAGLGVSGLAG